MMNPFGLPDEVFEMLVKEAIKQQTASKKSANPLNVDAVAMAKKSATTAKQLYDAYVEAGFTQEQAFELVKGILTAKSN